MTIRDFRNLPGENPESGLGVGQKGEGHLLRLPKVSSDADF
jgi:hypothetical protein